MSASVLVEVKHTFDWFLLKAHGGTVKVHKVSKRKKEWVELVVRLALLSFFDAAVAV